MTCISFITSKNAQYQYKNNYIVTVNWKTVLVVALANFLNISVYNYVLLMHFLNFNSISTKC